MYEKQYEKRRKYLSWNKSYVKIYNSFTTLNIILVYIRLKWMNQNHSIKAEAPIGRSGRMLTCIQTEMKHNHLNLKYVIHLNQQII